MGRHEKMEDDPSRMTVKELKELLSSLRDAVDFPPQSGKLDEKDDK